MGKSWPTHLNFSRVEQRAWSGRDVNSPNGVTTQVDGNEVVSHVARIFSDSVGVSNAQLAVVVAPEANDFSVFEKNACKIRPGDSLKCLAGVPRGIGAEVHRG